MDLRATLKGGGVKSSLSILFHVYTCSSKLLAFQEIFLHFIWAAGSLSTGKYACTLVPFTEKESCWSAKVYVQKRALLLVTDN